MSLKDRLSADLRDAMRSGDEVRKVTIRGALAAIRSAEDVQVKAKADQVLEGLSADPDDSTLADTQAVERISVDFADDDVIKVLQRQIKQRQDSVDTFRKANRQDLVAKESAEMAVLQQYLPRMMGRAEIETEARAVIAETGAAGPADKGKVMPVLMKRLAGKADGREINTVVTELLTGA